MLTGLRGRANVIDTDNVDNAENFWDPYTFSTSDVATRGGARGE